MNFSIAKLQEVAEQKGFNIYTFKVGWYNDAVGKSFQLPYSYNTMAIVLISNPDMFELNFIPYIKENGWTDDTKDPLDQSIAGFVSTLERTVFKDESVHTYFDYEFCPRTKRPKVLVQTAGHVAGAAFFYQSHHIATGEFEEPTKKRFGVCIHPLYGGWFAFRSVLVFPDQLLPEDMKLKEPPDVVPRIEDRIRLLDLFNESWQDNRFRDIVTPITRYSKLQQEYFSTPPKDRRVIVDKILET